MAKGTVKKFQMPSTIICLIIRTTNFTKIYISYKSMATKKEKTKKNNWQSSKDTPHKITNTIFCPATKLSCIEHPKQPYEKTYIIVQLHFDSSFGGFILSLLLGAPTIRVVELSLFSSFAAVFSGGAFESVSRRFCLGF